MSNSQTPTTVTRGAGKPGTIRVVDHVAMLAVEGGEEVIADPERLILCWNAHAPLVEALEKIALRGCADPGFGGCMGERCVGCTAREALARAEGRL